MTNVTKPTIARVYIPTPSGLGGSPLSRRYKPSGCLHAPAFFFRILADHPQRLWVRIDTAHYRTGAVRAQL